jgi:hypothetical protein
MLYLHKFRQKVCCRSFFFFCSLILQVFMTQIISNGNRNRNCYNLFVFSLAVFFWCFWCFICLPSKKNRNLFSQLSFFLVEWTMYMVTQKFFVILVWAMFFMLLFLRWLIFVDISGNPDVEESFWFPFLNQFYLIEEWCLETLTGPFRAWHH